jgi:Spy/CpxP family protein refolding chaperone
MRTPRALAHAARSGLLQTLRLLRLAWLPIVFIAATPTSIESARWWYSPRLVATLHLTTEQQTSMERIYRATMSERLRLAAEANASHDALDRIVAADSSYASVEAAATNAAAADAARRRARTLMLYRMWRVLTPAQRLRISRLQLLDSTTP